MEIWVWIILTILLLALICWWLVSTHGEKIIFKPTRLVVWHPPKDYECEEIWLNEYGKRVYPEVQYEGYKSVPKGLIHCWYFKRFGKGKLNSKTVLFSHGNAGNITHRRYIIEACKDHQANILVYDYRGFGKSKGSATTKNILSDAEMVYNYLAKQVEPYYIVIMGESLGGAPSAHLASKYPCSNLVLLSTFSHVLDIFDYGEIKGLGWISWAAGIICKQSIENINIKKMLEHVKCPVILVHSKEDKLICYKCAEINYDHIKHKCKSLMTIKGGHASPIIAKSQMEKMLTFADIMDCCSNVSFLEKTAKNIFEAGDQMF